MNEILTEIGLTEGEVKVYLALIKLGSSKTGALAKEAGVSTSKVYDILDRLEKKGLCGHVIEGKIKHFRAMEPSCLLDYMNQKEDQIKRKKAIVQEMIPELAKQLEASGQKSEATIYEGTRAIKNFFRNLLEELGEGDTYYVIGAFYGNESKLRGFFSNYHKRRADKGIRLKMLVNHEIWGHVVSGLKRKSEIRYLPQHLSTIMEILFYKNKAFIIVWTKEPKGFLIESEEAVNSFRAYFDVFWKIAKK